MKFLVYNCPTIVINGAYDALEADRLIEFLMDALYEDASCDTVDYAYPAYELTSEGHVYHLQLSDIAEYSDPDSLDFEDPAETFAEEMRCGVAELRGYEGVVAVKLDYEGKYKRI